MIYYVVSRLESAGYELDAVTNSVDGSDGSLGGARTRDRPLIRRMLKPAELPENIYNMLWLILQYII